MSDFLPSDYEEPKSVSRYWNKFTQGKSKFRILSEALPIWEWWEDADDGGRKPQRVMYNEVDKIPQEYKLETDDKAYFTWKLAVYDYDTKAVRVLSIRQKSIRSVIESFAENEDYGDPTGYDFTVNKIGEGFDTKYDVMPSPPKPLTDEVKKVVESASVDLKALLTGDDPFDFVDVDEVAGDLDSN